MGDCGVFWLYFPASLSKFSGCLQCAPHPDLTLGLGPFFCLHLNISSFCLLSLDSFQILKDSLQVRSLGRTFYSEIMQQTLSYFFFNVNLTNDQRKWFSLPGLDWWCWQCHTELSFWKLNCLSHTRKYIVRKWTCLRWVRRTELQPQWSVMNVIQYRCWFWLGAGFRSLWWLTEHPWRKTSG